MMRKDEVRALAGSALIAAVLLLLFSRCSPLYPTNPWGEANAFFTVGRGMLAGKVPYRDLELGAGPMVYALHMLAACVSDTGFLGVWLIEIAALTGLLFFSWKTAARISGMPVLSMCMTALAAALLVSSRAFVHGDTVEEFALPLQAWAICDLLACVQDSRRRISARRLLLHGFLAGCVFWLKYTLVGVHLAFIAVLAIDAMARQRELKGAIWMCLIYAAGAALATLPWQVYFAANGALGAWLQGYFNVDLQHLAETAMPLRDALAGLAAGAKNNPAAAIALLCGAGYLLRRLVHRRWSAGCSAVSAAFACAALLAYANGERYRFSPMAIGVFLMLCAGPAALLARYAWKRRRAYGALAAGAAALCLAYACATNDNLPFIGYPAGETAQARFAKIIEQEGGGSILTLDFADSGFYLAAGQLPEFAVFAEFGPYDGRGSQYRLTDDGAADWVISRSSYKPSGYYSLADQAGSAYDASLAEGRGIHQYWLYRKMEK